MAKTETELSEIKKDLEKLKKEVEDLYKIVGVPKRSESTGRYRRPRIPTDLRLLPYRNTGGIAPCYPHSTGGIAPCYY